MKASFAVAVGTALLLVMGMPLAQDAKAPGSKPNVTAPHAGPSMNMESQMGQMDEHMRKMQALHEKLATARTPEERQKLMHEQQAEMQTAMAMMNHMTAGGGMMGGMGGGMMGQKGKPGDAGAQMQMMQKRMDMMQMMMQSMMDQQGAMASSKGPDAAARK